MGLSRGTSRPPVFDRRVPAHPGPGPLWRRSRSPSRSSAQPSPNLFLWLSSRAPRQPRRSRPCWRPDRRSRRSRPAASSARCGWSPRTSSTPRTRRGEPEALPPRQPSAPHHPAGGDREPAPVPSGRRLLPRADRGVGAHPAHQRLSLRRRHPPGAARRRQGGRGGDDPRRLDARGGRLLRPRRRAQQLQLLARPTATSWAPARRSPSPGSAPSTAPRTSPATPIRTSSAAASASSSPTPRTATAGASASRSSAPSTRSTRRWAAGLLSFRDDRLESLYSLGKVETAFRHLTDSAEVYGGFSSGLVDGVTHRWQAGFTYSRDDF